MGDKQQPDIYRNARWATFCRDWHRAGHPMWGSLQDCKERAQKGAEPCIEQWNAWLTYWAVARLSM